MPVIMLDKGLIAVSGLSMGAIDNITFSYDGEHCPEMTEPICEKCAIDAVCAHYKELFRACNPNKLFMKWVYRKPDGVCSLAAV